MVDCSPLLLSFQVLFKDEETASWILQSNDPREQKELGRWVRNFDEEMWCKHRWGIVRRGNLAKVSVAIETCCDSHWLSQNVVIETVLNFLTSTLVCISLNGLIMPTCC